MSERNIYKEISNKTGTTAMENSEASMKLITQALVVDARVAIVYMRRAMFYLKEGMFDAMDDVLDAGIAVVPDNGALLLMRRDSGNYRTSGYSGE